MFNPQFFAHQHHITANELASKAALFCIDPTIYGFEYAIQRPKHWQKIIFLTSQK